MTLQSVVPMLQTWDLKATIAFYTNVLGFTLYIKTDHVDELWDRLKDKARLCYPLEDFDYGMREFAIYDNNGYVLQFGQPVLSRPLPRG